MFADTRSARCDTALTSPITAISATLPKSAAQPRVKYNQPEPGVGGAFTKNYQGAMNAQISGIAVKSAPLESSNESSLSSKTVPKLVNHFENIRGKAVGRRGSKEAGSKLQDIDDCVLQPTSVDRLRLSGSAMSFKTG